MLKEQEYKTYDPNLASIEKAYPGTLHKLGNALRVRFAPRELITVGVSGRQKH